MLNMVQIFVLCSLVGASLAAVLSTLPPIKTVMPGCYFQGKLHPVGDFKPSPCEYCHCDHNGRASCAIADCFFQQCVDAVHDPDQCCPTCPNGHNCRAPDNTTIQFGQVHVQKDGSRCQCSNFGIQATCTIALQSGCDYQGKHYPVGSFHPTPCHHCQCPHDGGQAYCAIVDCFNTPCVDSVSKPGHCCPTCPNGPNCYHGTTIISANTTYHPDSNTSCSCPTGFRGGRNAICATKSNF